MDALSTFFSDKDNTNNAKKKPYLKEIFKVAKQEERYRNGEMGNRACSSFTPSLLLTTQPYRRGHHYLCHGRRQVPRQLPVRERRLGRQRRQRPELSNIRHIPAQDQQSSPWPHHEHKHKHRPQSSRTSPRRTLRQRPPRPTSPLPPVHDTFRTRHRSTQLRRGSSRDATNLAIPRQHDHAGNHSSTRRFPSTVSSPGL